MSEVSDSDAPAIVTESDGKKKKGKKRPSDFEIVRTILQRTHERKLPYLFKNMGEDSDILFLCSEKEKGFTYGSPDLSVAIFEFIDPDLKTIIKTCLDKLYGLKSDNHHQCIINLREQISELSKTKGESIDVEVAENEFGSSWTVKKDINGKERETYFSESIDSLFHVQLVKHWCDRYRPLLTTDNPNHLYYQYSHVDSDTASILTLPPQGDSLHPLGMVYPHGFRTMVTRGLDVILDKFLEEFPYPVVKEELIVFQHESAACQIAHRIIAQGWRMVLLRPNAVFFPTLEIELPHTGQHTL